MPEEDKSKVENNQDASGKGATPTFEEWLSAADEPTKELIKQRFTALESTVKATRTERDDLKKELGIALKGSEKGSEAEKLLQAALSKVDVAEKKANFMEEAMHPEVGCKNPRTAYALATAEDLFNKSGAPDWTAIRNLAPELFIGGGAKGKAGAGTGEQIKSTDMNTIIRRIAGVQ